MNHTRVAIRFAVVVFWLIAVGLTYTAISNSGNAYALSWATWLTYGAIASIVLYIGFFATKHLWSIK